LFVQCFDICTPTFTEKYSVDISNLKYKFPLKTTKLQIHCKIFNFSDKNVVHILFLIKISTDIHKHKN